MTVNALSAPMTLTCEGCGAEYPAAMRGPQSQWPLCGKCRVKRRWERDNPKTIRECAYCGDSFIVRRGALLPEACRLCVKKARRGGLGGNLPDYWLRRILTQRDCDMCGGALPDIGAHVDHDHGCCPGSKTCGKCVRGILCQQCNTYVLPALEWYLTHRGRVDEYLT